MAASIAFRVSRLRDVNDRRIWAAMVVVVLAVWLVGAAVTKYSLEQMAFVTPIAMVVVGATIGLVLLWVKIVLDSLRAAPRRASRCESRARSRPSGGLRTVTG